MEQTFHMTGMFQHFLVIHLKMMTCIPFSIHQKDFGGIWNPPKYKALKYESLKRGVLYLYEFFFFIVSLSLSLFMLAPCYF